MTTLVKKAEPPVVRWYKRLAEQKAYDVNTDFLAVVVFSLTGLLVAFNLLLTFPEFGG